MAAEHRTVDATYWIATTPRTGYPPPSAAMTADGASPESAST
ncbi:hypothetical protein OOK13_34690 [Streptomyces sp. NBC_00378]|nr:hypothetical protein [Streptomyces sp. NBC_00378]MCX5113509.1 hypothetical protein [Streptomyces sp. NBC_00378]